MLLPVSLALTMAVAAPAPVKLASTGFTTVNLDPKLGGLLRAPLRRAIGEVGAAAGGHPQ
jgi:hypothetical protein